MRQILVFGEKTFRLGLPDDVRVTFAPFSPPTKGQDWNRDARAGTLRIYRGRDDIIAVFSGVSGFRDLSLVYAEQVAEMKGDTNWRDDQGGYAQQSNVTRREVWVDDPAKLT